MAIGLVAAAATASLGCFKEKNTDSFAHLYHYLSKNIRLS
jgi:hypothetical protein